MGRWLLTLGFTLLTIPAMAQTATVGARLNDIVKTTWNPLFILIATGSMLLGLWLAARGLLKLVEAASGKSEYRTGLVHIFIAAMLISLPDAAGVGMKSVFGQVRNGADLGAAELDYKDESGLQGNFLSSIVGAAGDLGTGSPENCFGSENPGPCIVKNLALHVAPVATFALFAMVFIAGLFIFASGLFQAARNSDGRPTERGTAVRLLVGVLLMNAPFLFKIATTTLLGTDEATVSANGYLAVGSSLLSYQSSAGAEAIQRYAEVIRYSLRILAFFGAFWFVRGIFMIKSTSEGQAGGGSYGKAMVHMIAGILLANAKFTSCAIAGSAGLGAVCA